jgi:hypothetical protein
MEVSMVAVSSGVVVRFMVLIVSQPVAEATVSVMLPAAVNTCPKMVTGKALMHTAVSMVAVSSGVVVRLMVLMVSQPLVEATVSVMLPAAVNTCPNTVTGKALMHTAVSMVAVSSGVVVRLMVLMVSQPVAEATVSNTVPAAVNT